MPCNNGAKETVRWITVIEIYKLTIHLDKECNNKKLSQ